MRVLSEFRHAIRSLCREPGFTLVTVLALGLGIGASTAIFSIVNGVLLRPLEYRDPDRLVDLREVLPALAKTYPKLPVSGRHFVEWRQRATSFQGITLMDPVSLNLTGTGEPERLEAARVSWEFLDTLGITPALGRGFLEGEDEAGHDKAAIFSDSLWRRCFHADPQILERSVTLDNQEYRVVGVLPPDFQFPGSRASSSDRMIPVHPEIYVPKVLSKEELGEMMGMFNYTAIGRLKAGVSREQASAELNLIGSQIAEISGEGVELRASISPLQEALTGRTRTGLLVLLGAVGTVLLIVCVNLGSLALARVERRRRESAIRIALGAGRGSLGRQALAESLIVATLGGTVGVGLAWAGLGTLLSAAPAELPRLASVRLDGQVLLFAFAATTLAGLIFGLAPAWRSASGAPQDALKAASQTATSGARVGRLRDVLVAVQSGSALLLVITAGLLAASLTGLMRADKGYTAPTVLAIDVSVPWAKYTEADKRNRFHERLLASLESQPGVVAAAVTTALPLEGETWVDSADLPGSNKPSYGKPMVNVRFVSPDYFRTMGIPIVGGRTFSGEARQKRIAVISERLAQTLWPGQDPVGRKFERNPKDEYEVIGVVGDIRADVDRPPVAMVYRPYWDWAPRSVRLVVRAAGDPRSVASLVRAAIWSVDRDVPVPKMRTMQEVLEESVATRRFQMLLASLFAGSALLVAALGIYGVVSYSVARRTKEMGIRMALGARASRIAGLVTWQGMLPVVAGLAAGIVVSLAVGRLLQSLLYEVSSNDPRIIGGATIALTLVGLAACRVPASRATRIDPLRALRYE
jgi:putative ABC transport system permease protein